MGETGKARKPRAAATKAKSAASAPPPADGSLALPQSEHVQPAVRRTIISLRADSLAIEPNTLLGAEDDLIKRYGVSRPTLRQAAGLVVQEQLLKVRRGVGGGYFADRPTVTAVAHMAAVFLQSRNTSMQEILLSIEPIRVELVRLSALNDDPTARAAWESFLEDEHEAEPSYRGFLKRERQFGDLLGQAGQNSVLNLFLQTVLELVATSVRRDNDLFVDRPDRVKQATARRVRIIQSILAGDPEIAVLEARRWAKASSAWLAEDRAEAAPKAAPKPAPVKAPKVAATKPAGKAAPKPAPKAAKAAAPAAAKQPAKPAPRATAKPAPKPVAAPAPKPAKRAAAPARAAPARKR